MTMTSRRERERIDQSQIQNKQTTTTSINQTNQSNQIKSNQSITLITLITENKRGKMMRREMIINQSINQCRHARLMSEESN
jgi:hypothetical protein